MKNIAKELKLRIKSITVFFMLALLVSGLTAIPVKSEVTWLLERIPMNWTAIRSFLQQIHHALHSCDETLLYGYDWLAFAHIIIAVLFVGVLKNPVRNIWIVEFGIIACLLILPFAFVMGQMRNIPLWWQLIDCSFGVIGLIPLLILRQQIVKLELLENKERHLFIF